MTDQTTPGTLVAFFDEWETKLEASIRRRVPHDHAAEEVTQEVLLALYHQVGDGPVPEGLPQLMFGIAAHKIADWYRSNIPKTASPPEPILDGITEPPAAGPGPGESPMDILPERRQDALEEVRRILPRLTPQQRDAVLYRHYDGMSVAEVAETLGVKHNAARRLLVRGMSNIRTLLRQAGYTISVSAEERPQ